MEKDPYITSNFWYQKDSQGHITILLSKEKKRKKKTYFFFHRTMSFSPNNQ